MILPGKGFYSGNKDRDYQRSFQGKVFAVVIKTGTIKDPSRENYMRI